jgi:hypothetical protein
MGRGSQGPNLSGLFTTFYPPNVPRHRTWDSDTLDEWLGVTLALFALSPRCRGFR